MGKPGKGRPRRVRQIVVYLLLLGAASAVVALALQPRDGAGGATDSNAASPGGGTPANYEYDAVNDRYWHAVDGGHWHNGPPPAGSGSGSTRANYEYDAVNNRHWHNDHWDSGPPPVGQR